MAHNLTLVHLMGMKEDGSSFLLRRWAQVHFIKNGQGDVACLNLELVQRAVWGFELRQSTEQELDRMKERSEELGAAERSARRTREREAWQERIEDACTVVEEWGLPGLHVQHVVGERPRARRRTEEDYVEEMEQLRQRCRMAKEQQWHNGRGRWRQ